MFGWMMNERMKVWMNDEWINEDVNGYWIDCGQAGILNCTILYYYAASITQLYKTLYNSVRWEGGGG